MPRNPRVTKSAGSVTRGMTGTNRLRRIDRWIAPTAPSSPRRTRLVIGLGFGASGVTSLELW